MQRQIKIVALATLLALTARDVHPDVRLSDFVQVLGSVTNAASPVEDVLVVALNLSTFYATQTFSGRDGSFRLPPMQAGVYRIIAVKRGFAPAFATVMPKSARHALTFKLKSEAALTRSQKDEIWAMRSSLPKDILRDIDAVVGPLAAEPPAPLPRFEASMVSVASVDAEVSNASLTQTEVGLRGPVGGGWVLDFKGNVNRMNDLSLGAEGDLPLAESAGVVMELQAGPSEGLYRLASTRSSWRAPDSGLPFDGGGAGIQSHNFEWSRPGSKVQVRYLTQDNVFHDQANSELFELSGDKLLMQSSRSRLGVSMTLGQESYVSQSAAAVPYRTANLAANGQFAPAQAIVLHYGLHTRVGETGSEWAPETAAEWRFGKKSSLIFSGSYKVFDDRDASFDVPSLIFWTQTGNASPKYRYSVALSSQGSSAGRVSAVGTISVVDSLVRIVFDQRVDQLVDGLYLEPGDERRDLSLEYSRNVGKHFVVDVSTSAGTAESEDSRSDRTEKFYLIGDLQSHYKPTGTSIQVSYRQIEQPHPLPLELVLQTERMNVTMGQSLHLPLDIRVLIGMELARLGSFLPGTEGDEIAPLERRYVGGLSFNF